MREQVRAALQKHLQRVITLFHSWDENGDGKVSKAEFRKALRALGFEGVDTELDALFDEFDADGGGSIEYQELNAMLRQGERFQTDESRYTSGLSNCQAHTG